MDKITAVYQWERDTKRTRRFAELLGQGPELSGLVYLKKAALQALTGGELPERIRLTVEVDAGGSGLTQS